MRLRVTHVLSGETRYFRTWPDVVNFLLAKLQAALANSTKGEGEDG
jgi:hypothetical protein